MTERIQQNVYLAIDFGGGSGRVMAGKLTDGKLELESVAEAVHYSKYHLHRLFTETVGMTIHDYVQRRQLTEAAKLLVFSDQPIIEIALICGYESQQSFSSAFKAMYKSPPAEYREKQSFYPLLY